jgi:transcription-repair coupling factor (superfamily II helicase)
MGKVAVSSLFTQSSNSRKLRDNIVQSQEKITISGLAGSSLSLVIAEIFKTSEKPFLFILNDK